MKKAETLHIFAAGSRLKTAFLLILTIIVLILFPTALKDTLVLAFGGVVFAFILSPLAKLYEKRFSQQKSACLALFTAAAILALVIVVAVPFLIRQFSVLAERIPDTVAQINASIGGRLPDFSSFQGNFSSVARSAMDYAGSIADIIYRFVLMAVLGCFFLADRQRVLLRAELMLPFSRRKEVLRHANILLGELKMYIRGQMTIALCVGAVAALLLSVIGVPSGILLGAVVGIFNVIPYFGPIIGGIPAVLAAYGDSWQKAALTLGALILVQQIDGMVISPRIMGSATGFSPAVVLIALYAASKLCGVAGLLFAMPALMAIRTLYRVFVQRYEKN